MKGPTTAPRRSHRARVAALVMCAVMLALLGVRHVAGRQEVVRLGYELTEATAELRDRMEENRRLRLEKSVLTSPERIERLARSMGMVSPGPDQVRIVDVRDEVLSALGWGR
jgi:cell division protein FtsL